MSEITAKYSPKNVEDKWYKFWMDNHFFHSEPNEKKPYTIVIPPPNVTGVLHMGHMLNNTIQDVLIRRARMLGYNACWVPGTDHASIATEAKVVNKLKEQGISKFDIGREKFLEHAWEWTHTHGGIILEQLKKLGCSCDWDRTKFTLDGDLYNSVIKCFVDLYNRGYIYKGNKMINWDPEAKTNISDEEVIYKEHNGKLYFLRYKVAHEDHYVIVATTRPETIFGDTALCINPNDERYQFLKGKKVIVPICNREIPVIEDEYVDMEFGTGVLKITPAHDVNDYNLGKKHQLATIDIFNDNATLNDNGLHYKGKDRFIVRKEITKELKEKNLLEKEENYVNKVGTSERTGAVIEPKISVQWFMKMKDFAKPALDAVLNEELKLYPDKFVTTYKNWLEDIHDWNISRQLWWGHRIPAYYYGEGENDFVIAETKEEALKLAQEKNSSITSETLRQEEDVLDTWFSSWLWPISVFNGINEPDNKEINYYYPTQDLVTGPDIIFFWVARMVMAGYAFRNEKPFSNVYFTGIVRDKLRRKMSKQLGNSPDPLKLIEEYGADGVRVGVLLSSSAGNDLMFDEDLCLQGRNFSNKIWNSFRLVQSWNVDSSKPQTIESKEAISWLKNKIAKTVTLINGDFEKYRISDALMNIYKLIWDDYCSWYLEAVKPPFGEDIDEKTYIETIAILEDLLKLLHPFMPFISEEIWQTIKKREIQESLIITSTVSENAYNESIISDFEVTKEIISSIRNFRSEKGLSPKESLTLIVKSSDKLENIATIKKLANISQIKDQLNENEPSYTFLVGKLEFAIPFTQTIDTEAEKAKILEDIAYLEGFLKSINAKLSNEKFVNGAPQKVVEMERKKQSDTLEKLTILKESLKKL
ncbi:MULTISPECIES: valine--tRNA ligase [unclassified Apibacter]|uniref:valine--tRNA ligase n=1 Tax=unclassified Apibacter TaxID=2630820 RepID=UPI00132BE976|nr:MULTISPECIES: valine--tRNA ligase [unclassified Apibacter]MCX8676158.1 valine--tRNA ligase [Apibacter sp. B3919]MXO25298.1 valine--tRNA ligase [Apibacter sp. B3924]MXO26692.1 valine--tRNA ligase [Apibacter sp. B3813]MXO29421.1 valine--tRNA ligase [Apibacter sp. B3913]MXO30970.1 valine--tRNA ligase [Apibacter sp. B3912]